MDVETQMVLETDRLRLRPLRSADAGLIRLYSQEAAVARMTRSIPHPIPPGATEAFVARVLSGKSDMRVWAVEHKGATGDALIGLISVTEEGEIGYWLGAPFWSTGFATEAVEAVVAHVTAKGARSLFAEVFQDNPASARVLSKAGFAYLGEDEAYSLARGGQVPVWRYALQDAT